MIRWIIDKYWALWDWWQDMEAESERAKLAKLKGEDEEARILHPLEVQVLNAEASRLEAEVGVLAVTTKRKEAK